MKKKICKRAVSLLLGVIMVIGMLPAAVFAANNTISFGQELQFTCEGDQETIYTLTYTAAESGRYVLVADQWSGMTLITLYDSNGKYIVGSHTRCEFTAEKGEIITVELWLRPFGGEEKTTTVRLMEPAPATSVSFVNTYVESFLGTEYMYINIEGKLQPANATVSGTWTSSNPEVAEISFVESGFLMANLIKKAAGTTTVTFTSDSGITATCTVVIKESGTITLGTPVQYTVGASDSVGYTFVAPEDGFYCFFGDFSNEENGNEDIAVSVEGDIYFEDGRIDGGSYLDMSRAVVGLRKGRTYLIRVKNQGSSAHTGTLTVIKTIPAASLEISSTYNPEYNMPVGNWRRYEAVFNPEFAAPEAITWTSSNPAVLNITNTEHMYCWVESLAEGTAVLTATSASGLTDQITVTVGKTSYNLEGDLLKLDAPNRVVPQYMDDRVMFEFTPTRSGYYHFDHDAEKHAGVGIAIDNERLSGLIFKKTYGGYLRWLDAGKTYYIWSGYFDNGTIPPYNIYVSRVNPPVNGWHNVRSGWFYFKNSKPVSGWQKIDGKWYYFDWDATMARGLQYIDGKRYYLNNDMKTGWQQINGEWYFFASDGSMQTGWVQTGGKWYYLNSYGVMQTGWVQIDGRQYYLDSSGAMKTGWQKINGQWYYLDSFMKTGWQSIGGKWYYLNNNGIMQTGWTQIDGRLYYLDSNGTMKTGWQKIDGQWYYLDSYVKTGWQKIDGQWYYLNSYMKTGWQKIDGSWYYLGSYMKTGWQKIDGSWYYLGSNGVMRTGWQYISGNWYYLGTNGIMVTGTKVIDGVTYTFDASGAMIK